MSTTVSQSQPPAAGEAAHTERWSAILLPNRKSWQVFVVSRSGNGRVVVSGLSEKDAGAIAADHNAHAGLVEALVEAVGVMEAHGLEMAVSRARAALAAASKDGGVR